MIKGLTALLLGLYIFLAMIIDTKLDTLYELPLGIRIVTYLSMFIGAFFCVVTGDWITLGMILTLLIGIRIFGIMTSIVNTGALQTIGFFMIDLFYVALAYVRSKQWIESKEESEEVWS